MSEKQTQYMHKFRKQNRRYDYYPTPEAIAAIERMKKFHPDAPTRALIDLLLVAGIKATVAQTQTHARPLQH
jgi:hypothetical protein